MTTDPIRRRRIEEVCDAALERDEPERAAFVKTACEGDETLQHEVEALLAHVQTSDRFLEAPIGEVAAAILEDTPSSSTHVGQWIGPYQILALIGEGGMGRVYRARDTKLGREVAIKVMAEALLSNPLRRARFEREARVLATLNHPHIGAIFGSEDAGGASALVLELIEGQTLAERLVPRALPVPAALDIARQIAEAIEAAHEKGVIHRDLKPANIKITPDGIVKVLDFGLAKVLAPEDGDDRAAVPPANTLTIDGTIAGTVGYMSPEQTRGLAIDKRTDVWSFGCVLYEMLSGRAPFAAATISDAIAKILEREPDWSVLPADTPAGVQRLLRRCLEKNAKRRLRDIGDARIEIEDALEAGEEVALRGGPRRSDASPRPSQKLWTGVAGAALLVAAVATTWYVRESEVLWRNPLDGATFTPLTDFKGAEHHAAISRDGKLVAYLWDGDGQWDAWVTQVGSAGSLNRTRDSGLELRNPGTRTLGFTPDATLLTLWSRMEDAAKGGRVNAYWSVAPLSGSRRPYLAEMPQGISELDWSPDGSQIVYHPPIDGDPLFITDAQGKTRRQIHTERPGVHNHFPTWSPDGQYVYFVKGFPRDEMDVWRIRESGGTPEQVTFHNSRVSFPTMIDDRTLLYLATDDDGAGPWLYSTDVERRKSHRVTTGVEQYWSLAAGDGGKRLVATTGQSMSTLWRVQITEKTAATSATQLALPTASGSSPRIGAGYVIYRTPKAGIDGLRTLSGTTSNEVYAGPHGRVLGAPAVAADGRLAFVVRRGAGARQLYVMDGDGGRLRSIANDLDVRGAPSWSMDGKWLAIAAMESGEPRLFKIPVAGGKPEQLVHDYSTDPTWSPDGTFLVYTGADVGTTFSLKAVNADGSPHPVPDLLLSRGERRLVFLGAEKLVVLKGNISQKDFHLIDLKSGRQTRLTNLGRAFLIGDFDVSPDGREIIFDRAHEESNIMLIDLKR